MIRVSQNGLKTRVTQRNMPAISVSKIAIPFSGGGIDYLLYWTTQPEVLFFGLYSEIAGGQMPNKVTGAVDFLTIAGVAGSETYQAPNTASYIAADTDNIWFLPDGTQRIATTAELIGYDLQRTPVKYDDTNPYAIQAIIILKSGEVLSAGTRDNLFKYMWLPLLWDNNLNAYGHIKENRVGQNLWKPNFVSAVVNAGTGSSLVMTFDKFLDDTSVPATTAFEVLVNTVARNVTNVSILDGEVTLTLSSDVVFGDTVTVEYIKPIADILKGITGAEIDSFAAQSVTNNTLVYLNIVADGTGLAVATLNLRVSSDTTLTMIGNARFYSDAAGTLDESTSWLVTSGANRTRYIRCLAGTSLMTFSNHLNFIRGGNGYSVWYLPLWSKVANGPYIGGDISKFTNLTILSYSGTNTLSGDLSALTLLTDAYVYGGSVTFGNMATLTALKYLVTDRPTAGDISGLTSLLQLALNNGAGNTCTGSIAGLVNLQSFGVQGLGGITVPNVTNITGLCSINLGSGDHLEEALVNQILADFWANRDAAKPIATRSINIAGVAGSHAPSGQGIIDKAALQEYSSPTPPGTAELWTVTTR